MKNFKEEFKVVQNVAMETSAGLVAPRVKRTMDFTVCVENGRGWFELYDEESGGRDFYAEGCLIFNGEELKSSKKDKSGNYPLRPSWYKEGTGLIVISITNFPLLGTGKGIPCTSKEKYGQFLQKFKDTWKTDPNIKKMMDVVKQKYDDRLKTLRKNS